MQNGAQRKTDGKCSEVVRLYREQGEGLPDTELASQKER